MQNNATLNVEADTADEFDVDDPGLDDQVVSEPDSVIVVLGSMLMFG